MAHMAESLVIQDTVYLGGFGHLDLSEPRWGTLVLSDETVTLTRVQSRDMRRIHDIEMCRTRAIASIEVTSEQVAQSKVGPALVFGILGLAAKGAADRSTLVVSLRNASTGYFIVKKYFAAQLLAIIDPWRQEMGIGLGGAPEVAGGPVSIADEIAKLAQLRDSGALSEDEFVLLKTRLIETQMTE